MFKIKFVKINSIDLFEEYDKFAVEYFKERMRSSTGLKVVPSKEGSFLSSSSEEELIYYKLKYSQLFE